MEGLLRPSMREAVGALWVLICGRTCLDYVRKAGRCSVGLSMEDLLWPVSDPPWGGSRCSMGLDMLEDLP